MTKKPKAGRTLRPLPPHTETGPYVYGDELGRPVLRHQRKGAWERWQDGEWVKGGKKRWYLYHLPEILKHRKKTVYVVEGEKCAEYMKAHGFLATTSGGATTWRSELFPASLRERDVVVLPDNDEPGFKYAETVARSLSGIAASVKIVWPKDLGITQASDDIADWFAAGHTATELRRIVKDAAFSEEAARLQTLDEVELRSVQWLWKGYIPRDRLTLLGGEPGIAKSTMAVTFASILSVGGNWPDGTEQKRPGGAIILSLEDAKADTIGPRAQAAGGTLSRIAAYGTGDDLRRYQFPQGLVVLARLVEDMRDKLGSQTRILLVLDPLSSFLPTDSDQYRESDVRHTLGQIENFAAEQRVTVLGIVHVNKRSAEPNPMMRFTGSAAFVQFARSSLVAGRARALEESDNPPPKDRIYGLAPLKTNLTEPPSTLSYFIEDRSVKAVAKIRTSGIRWGTEINDVTAFDLLASAQKVERGKDGVSKTELARDFLREVLKDGPLDMDDVIERGEAEGLNENVIKKAKHGLKIESIVHRDSSGHTVRSEWKLAESTKAGMP